MDPIPLKNASNQEPKVDRRVDLIPEKVHRQKKYLPKKFLLEINPIEKVGLIGWFHGLKHSKFIKAIMIENYIL